MLLLLFCVSVWALTTCCMALAVASDSCWRVSVCCGRDWRRHFMLIPWMLRWSPVRRQVHLVLLGVLLAYTPVVARVQVAADTVCC